MIIHCEGFSLPLSPLLSDQTRKILEQAAVDQEAALASDASTPTTAPTTTPTREETREQFYQSELYKTLRAKYPVDVTGELIGGVFTEIITPKEGVSAQNAQRVLINFHGGSFEFGSRTTSQLESIPVASLGKIKVISVDYRMYPEHRFPAATDDALAVYKALLKDYSPQNIGVFGSSSGAQLSTQLVYRLQEQKIPLPAAVALISEAATKLEGDSIAFNTAIYKGQYGLDLADELDMGYFENITPDDPAVYPALSDDCMAAFPPSFLSSSTRDLCLSPVIATHRKLLQQGVEAELHVWEGLDHCFHYNPELPETKELHETMLTFFNRHL